MEARLAADDSEVEAERAPWVRSGKVRARVLKSNAVELEIDGLTTQAKYYKPLLREFFRKSFPMRPRWGDFLAEIEMRFTGDPPHMDLDNLAKAMLDSAVGTAFYDDSQISKLVVERVRGEREGVWMRLTQLSLPGETRTG